MTQKRRGQDGCAAGCRYCPIRQLGGRKSSVWAATAGCFWVPAVVEVCGGCGDKRRPSYLCIKGYTGLAEEAKATTICVFQTWLCVRTHTYIASLTHICVPYDERCIVRKRCKAPPPCLLQICFSSCDVCAGVLLQHTQHNVCTRWLKTNGTALSEVWLMVRWRVVAGYCVICFSPLQTIRGDLSFCAGIRYGK